MKLLTRAECALVQDLLSYALNSRGSLTDAETRLATELTDLLLPPTVPEINGDTLFSDYCRWESGGLAETHAIYAEWQDKLQAVGAEITSQWCGDESCEINYQMTLRQAYRIGWTFDQYGGSFDLYLASQIVPDAYLNFDHPEVKRVATLIEALWERWADETRTAGYKVEHVDTGEEVYFAPDERPAADALFREHEADGDWVHLYEHYDWVDPTKHHDDPPLPDLINTANASWDTDEPEAE